MLKKLLFLFIFINSVQASFLVQKEGVTNYMIFNDFEFLQKLEAQEVSYEQFKEQVISSLSSTLEEEYKCTLLEGKPKCKNTEILKTIQPKVSCFLTTTATTKEIVTKVSYLLQT